MHLRYAVERNKHIFAEKPVATDAVGLRHVLESVRMAKEKKLHFVSGFCWRSDLPRRALYDRIDLIHPWEAHQTRYIRG